MRMDMKQIIMVAALATVGVAGAVEWRNLDQEHQLGGRKASEGYLRGKVVLVDRWGLRCPPCRAMLPQVEALWQSFKTKPFVVLGGHCKGWGEAEDVKKFVAQQKLTYPIYEDAGLATGEPEFDAIPFLYVVDETGKVVYTGHSERMAREAIVNSLTDMEAPRNLAQWRRFLDFELEHLPGRAYLRANEFRKKFPAEAKEYYEKFKALTAIPDVKKLAELVAFSRTAKDSPAFGPKDKVKKDKFARLIKSAISKYASLKESADPRVAQEAKNALADLIWAEAAL